MTSIDRSLQRRARLKLLLVFAVFAAPALVAALLIASGWQPTAQGHGEPILPQRNFEQAHVPVQLASGQRWRWRDSEPRLTLVALPGPHCAERCFQALTGMAKARVMLNRNQSRLRLLYLGEPPVNGRAAMQQYWQLGTDVDHAFATWRPTTPDTVSALLVESNGTALSLYPAGFDASGLAQDLQKVIK